MYEASEYTPDYGARERALQLLADVKKREEARNKVYLTLIKVTKLLDIIVCGGIIELAADIFLRKCYKAVIFCCDNVAFFAHKEDLETLLIGIENRCKFL